jgi:hypothetical protein
MVVVVAVVVALAVVLWNWGKSLPCATMISVAARMIAPWRCQLPPARAMMT